MLRLSIMVAYRDNHDYRDKIYVNYKESMNTQVKFTNYRKMQPKKPHYRHVIWRGNQIPS